MRRRNTGNGPKAISSRSNSSLTVSCRNESKSKHQCAGTGENNLHHLFWRQPRPNEHPNSNHDKQQIKGARLCVVILHDRPSLLRSAFCSTIHQAHPATRPVPEWPSVVRLPNRRTPPGECKTHFILPVFVARTFFFCIVFCRFGDFVAGFLGCCRWFLDIDYSFLTRLCSSSHSYNAGLL